MVNPKVIGVVLDISLRHDDNDLRVADIVKEQLIQFVKTLDDFDYFYVFHEDNLKTFYRRGQQVYTISKYQPTELPISLPFALKQTLYVLAAEDNDYKKFMYYITDRSINDNFIKRVQSINEKDEYGIELSTISLRCESKYVNLKPQQIKDYLIGVHDGNSC